MAVLELTPDVRDQMLAHALAGVPNEACGMFSSWADATLVDEFHAMHNAAESAMVFALDGQEMLDLESQVDDRGRTLAGVMHSHTHTSAYPSPTDVRDIARFDPFGTFHHIIVSLRDAEPVLRSFRVEGESITEEPVIIVEDDPVEQGQAGAAAVMQLPKR